MNNSYTAEAKEAGKRTREKEDRNLLFNLLKTVPRLHWMKELG